MALYFMCRCRASSRSSEITAAVQSDNDVKKWPKLLSSLQIVAKADIVHNLVAYMCKMRVESCFPFSRFKVVVFNKINVEDIIDLTKVS